MKKAKKELKPNSPLLIPITEEAKILRWSDESGQVHKSIIVKWSAGKTVFIWFLIGFFLGYVYQWLLFESHNTILNIVNIGLLIFIIVPILLILLVKVLISIEDYLENRQRGDNINKQNASKYLPQSIVGKTKRNKQIGLEKKWENLS